VRKFEVKFKEKVVREQRSEHPSMWAALESIALIRHLFKASILA
jgi:hypothetical protein